jgi:hypothetical protein
MLLLLLVCLVRALVWVRQAILVASALASAGLWFRAEFGLAQLFRLCLRAGIECLGVWNIILRASMVVVGWSSDIFNEFWL